MTQSLFADGATFSPCRTWRYSLTRQIHPVACDCFVRVLDAPAEHAQGCALSRQRTVTFIGLNPSTADETTDDPTIRRCVRYARDWGYDRLKMVNLYAYRSTDPKGLWIADDPVGPENDHNLSLAFGGSDLTIAAWGANARADRIEQFVETFGGWRFYALGITKNGAPRHPLYMRADVQPFVYHPRGGLVAA